MLYVCSFVLAWEEIEVWGNLGNGSFGLLVRGSFYG